MHPFALEGGLLRRAARWGSSRGPEWFVRAAPPLVGLVACAVAGGARRSIAHNLRIVRGQRGAMRDAVDVARTFSTYAACLAETLGAGSPRGRLPDVLVRGELHIIDALKAGRGLVLATAHTAGWETVGPLLTRDLGVPLLIATSAESDPTAGAVQDAARRAMGLIVVHVGDDPLTALPLMHHLREGGAVALQIDRVPSGLRRRAVTMFGRAGHVPEGPLRLATLTGAPLVPVFATRTGHRRYEVHALPAMHLASGATEVELDAAAQRLADAMQTFVRLHPTQWFHFRDGAL